MEIVRQLDQDQKEEFMSGLAQTVANKINKAALKKAIEENPDIFDSAVALTGDSLIRQKQARLLAEERSNVDNPQLELSALPRLALSKLHVDIDLTDPAILTQVFQNYYKLELVETLNDTQIYGLKLKYTGDKNKKQFVAFGNPLDYDLSKAALDSAEKQIEKINKEIESDTNSHNPLMGVSSNEILEQFTRENKSEEEIVRLLNTLDLDIKEVDESPTKVL